jgi:hypothetical protein
MSQSIEAARAKFRPERVLTLFVGESAPASGKFFYGDENLFARHMGSGISRASLPAYAEFSAKNSFSAHM